MKGMVCRTGSSEDNTVRQFMVVPRPSEFPGIDKIQCYRLHFDSCFQQQGPGRYDLYLCYPNHSYHIALELTAAIFKIEVLQARSNCMFHPFQQQTFWVFKSSKIFQRGRYICSNKYVLGILVQKNRKSPKCLQNNRNNEKVVCPTKLQLSV